MPAIIYAISRDPEYRAYLTAMTPRRRKKTLDLYNRLYQAHLKRLRIRLERILARRERNKGQMTMKDKE